MNYISTETGEVDIMKVPTTNIFNLLTSDNDTMDEEMNKHFFYL